MGTTRTGNTGEDHPRNISDEILNIDELIKNIVLNDQGGAVMSITYGKTWALRAQIHQHPPLVMIRKHSKEK